MKKLFYGFGNLGYSVIGQTVSNFFMFFATSVLGVSGTLVGIAVAISTIWDGLSDTIIGYISDKYPIGKFGHRNGYMLIATIGMSIVNIALWCIPNGISIVLKFVWILVSLLLLETFNTMFATPYSALGNELASSYNDRTKINAISTVFYLIGIIIPSVLLLIFLPNTTEYPIGQLNPKGYIYISIVTSAICLIFGLISSLFTIHNGTKNKNENRDNLHIENIKDSLYDESNKDDIYVESDKDDIHVESNKVNENNKMAPEKFSLKVLIGNFFLAFRNKRLCRIILGYVLTSIATVFLCSVGLHFFTYSFFYSSNQITFLLLTLMLGTIISQPLWVKISKKRNKKPALVSGILTTILAIFAIIFIYLFRIEIYNISYYLMLVAIFVCGVGSGALYSLPTSIYGDLIEEATKNGENRVATYSGTMTFAGNIGNSITQLIVGILLDLIGFDSSLQIQTLKVQTGLALILFVGVQVSLILACFVFAGHRENTKRNN